MADFSYARQSPGPLGPNQAVSNNPADDISVDLGAPVILLDELDLCDASAAATSNCAGLCCGAGERNAVLGAPGQVRYQFAGPLKLTTEQWDNITGQSGGLTPHSTYYLSVTTGKLSTTKPVGGTDFIAPVGFAMNPTTMMIQIPGNPAQVSP